MVRRSDPLDILDAGERAGLPRREPRFVEPMLATLTEEHFSHPDWLYERKLDGVRIVIVRDGSSARLYSRNRKPLDGTYPELVDALDLSAPAGLVADGEVVAFDGTRTSFERLQGRLAITDPARARATGVNVTLYLFDAMALAGHDLTGLPLRRRKQVLRSAVDYADPIRFSAHRNAAGEAYLRQACERGWEGLIAKRADGRYRPGRRVDEWLKFKCVREQEFVVVGYTDPAGSRTGFGAVLVGYYDRRGGDAVLRYAGKVGTGFDECALADLRSRFDDLVVSEPRFADGVRERGAHWLRPELVAQIAFTEWTRDGRLRHPRYLGLRDDKPPTEVVREVTQ
jgi:bifunctional non-homologous end joining protein LigD